MYDLMYSYSIRQSGPHYCVRGEEEYRKEKMGVGGIGRAWRSEGNGYRKLKRKGRGENCGRKAVARECGRCRLYYSLCMEGKKREQCERRIKERRENVTG